MLFDDYVLCFLAGVVTAGILGFLFQRIRLTQKSIGKVFEPRQPSLDADKSPSDTVFGCIGSRLSLLLLILVLGVRAWFVGQFWG